MTMDRAFLIARTENLLIAEPTIQSRLIEDEDLPNLAQLFLDSYMGSVDEKEKTLDEAQAALDTLISGNIGDPMRDLWLAIYEGSGPPVSAILCTKWKGVPFMAHILTEPGHRGRGYASSLIRDAARVIEADGGDALGTMVTRTNPSMKLYRELGFQEMFVAEGVSA
jgi:ribosomal protein S18 acetylase RimI-like enzyme